MSIQPRRPVRVVAQRLLAAPRWNAAAEADFAALLSMAGEHELSLALMGAHSRRSAPPPACSTKPQPDAALRGQLAEAESDCGNACGCNRIRPRRTGR